MFGEGAKVVISPDKMRAWVTLPKPKSGVRYTAQAIMEWLPQNGVVYGADEALCRQAAASERYDDLLEVARGRAAVPATGGDYSLRVEKKPFTGLKSAGDGSLIYDDFSFLQEVQEGEVLADLIPPKPAEPGMTVTGEEVFPREGSPGRRIKGSGFAQTPDGLRCVAPSLGHVTVINNDELIFTPLHKAGTLSDGEALQFAGNVLVEGDLRPGASVEADGSVFVTGRASGATIKAGNNILLAAGMRAEGGRAQLQAKGNVWGPVFDMCDITAGGDVHASTISGCSVRAEGRLVVSGGRAPLTDSDVYARGGVVAGQIGSPAGNRVTVAAGMGRELMDKAADVERKVARLTIDIQTTQQNIATHERVNRMKPDKGRGDAAYLEMMKKRDQALSVLNILTTERTRLRRLIDQFSTTTIIAREVVYPGVTIEIDTRAMNIMTPMKKTKFRRTGEVIEASSSAR